MKNINQVLVWFEELSDGISREGFKDLINKTHENEAIAAILWLYTKIKEEEKPQKWFLHGEHDVIYIGASFDIFTDFTEDDVKTALNLGIFPADDGDGFQIYASM